MENKIELEEQEQIIHLNNVEITDLVKSDLEELELPQMNVSVPAQPPSDVSALISDSKYLDFLDEIMGNIREDRQQVSEYIDNIANMVINDGDATTSSKEALVNLFKIKTDLQDKMLKTAELMTRLKVKNTYAYSGPHLNAMQQNNFNIGSDTELDRKDIIKAFNNAKKKKEKNV
jgi:cell division ATPase FtsA